MKFNESNVNFSASEYLKERRVDSIILFALMAVVVGLTMFFSGALGVVVEKQCVAYLEDKTIHHERFLDEMFFSSRMSIKNIALLYERQMRSPEVDWRDLKEIEDNALFDYLRFVNLDGVAIDSSGKLQDVKDRDYYKKGVKGEFGTDVILRSRFNGESIIVTYAPLRYKGEIIGVFTGVYGEVWLENFLMCGSNDTDTISVLCMPSGSVFATSHKEFIGINVLDYYRDIVKLPSDVFARVNEVFSSGGNLDFSYKFKGGTEIAFLIKNARQSWVLLRIYPPSSLSLVVNRYNSILLRMQVASVCIFALYIVYFALMEMHRRKLFGKATRGILYNSSMNLADTIAILSGYYYKVLRVNLLDGTFKAIKSDDLAITNYRTFDEWVAHFVESGSVYKDDVEDFVRYFNRAGILNHFTESDEHIVHRCRREMNGGLRWIKVEIQKSIEYTAENPIVVLYVLDVTDDVARELQLEAACRSADKANKAKSEFLSHISHEIRTPMNAIIGMSSIASMHLDDTQYLSDCLKKITVSSNHLMDLLNQVLDMSKIESGKIDLSVEHFSIGKTLDNVMTIIKPLSDAKGHILEFSIGELRNENVIGDEKRLRQVLVNFLSNAIKYTPDAGRINFSVVERESSRSAMACFEFTVEDNGIGMSEEYQAHIFESFTRADDEQVAKTQGTGLGMAIAYAIVKMMGGDIIVHSTLGSGSKFIFTVSLGIQQDEDAFQESEKNNLSLKDLSDWNVSGKRVLLVDDIELNLEVASEILKSVGLEVECVGNGEAALEKVKSVPDGYYDMIFMDVQMPVMDGYEATAKIRALDSEYAKNVPIIAMTANAFSDDVDNSIKAGMNGHVSKPIELKQLFNILKKYLGD